jgi:L-alanine-DL-glutamate epimerase-like enolase superfamily enzyme
LDTPEDLPEFRLARVEAMVFRVPISTPVVTSFGTMTDRPAVVVRIEDIDGAVGWGEVWCNFPNVGAEHRARMLENYVAPLLLTRPWPDPIAAFSELTNRLHVLGLQCGEPGTIAQIIAGADIALWDLAGKRAGQPLWKLLGGGPAIRPYASGINPTNAERLAATKLEEGYRAFKLKIGFGAERDLANLTALRKLLGPEMPLMADVNQAWDPATAFSMLPRLREYNLEWLEEPVPADTPWQVWQELSGKADMPLAAGENLRGEAAFEEALETKAIGVFQPDLGKWGGFSGCVPLGRQVKAAGYLFCPHWLGGGIGLAASMHLKAAIGGPGYLEVDANENPLRESLGGPLPDVVAGISTLSDRPGLGVDPDVKGLRSFQR